MSISRKRMHSRFLLERLKESLAEPGKGQDRLDRIVKLIASSMNAEVCSIYLKRDGKILELFATHGLKADAVHFTKLKIGQGLVGKIAQTAKPINTSNAPETKGYYFRPETGEEGYPSFLGVAIQRLGETLGVLIVQNSYLREYTRDELYGLEIVAMVLAEMTELGAFTEGSDTQITAQHTHPVKFDAIIGSEGIAVGEVLLHDPIITIENPIANDPRAEKIILNKGLKELRDQVKGMISKNFDKHTVEYLEIFEAYQMFANDKGWKKRMEASIDGGLAATVAVEKEQSENRARMSRLEDPYIRDRLHDLDDVSNRLLRILTKTEGTSYKSQITNGILVARNIGPAELLDYGSKLAGVVLEEGSVGAHATIVARALGIPILIQADRITREARIGDKVIVDALVGKTFLRPEKNVLKVYLDKIASQRAVQKNYLKIRDKPAVTTDGIRISLLMNAGLMIDFKFLKESGAEGIGLYRTELQFLTERKIPRRVDQVNFYSSVLDAAGTKPVNFRTLDIGSDKFLPYLKTGKEPNPALGWRAIRIALDRTVVMRMQAQALIRGSRGRPIRLLFPLVTEFEEFLSAKNLVLEEIRKEKKIGHDVPDDVKIGAMLETPSLAFADEKFFKMVDFIAIGGNDLKQFFFAADRGNELVRRRYDSLNLSYIEFLKNILSKAAKFKTPVSYCGEDAGKPVEALALAAIGIRTLSMRASAIGPVKLLIRSVALKDVTEVINRARQQGKTSVRKDLTDWLAKIKASHC